MTDTPARSISFLIASSVFRVGIHRDVGDVRLPVMNPQLLARGQGFRPVGPAPLGETAERVALEPQLERARVSILILFDGTLGMCHPAKPDRAGKGAAGGEDLPPVPAALRYVVMSPRYSQSSGLLSHHVAGRSRGERRSAVFLYRSYLKPNGDASPRATKTGKFAEAPDGP